MRINKIILDQLINNHFQGDTLYSNQINLTEEDRVTLFEVLKKNTQLMDLDLPGNQIGTEGAEALAQNTTLTKLDLSLNQIGDAGAIALAQNTTLTTLDLSLNQIGDAGAEALAQNTTLTTLHLTHNYIDTKLMRIVAYRIEENRINCIKSFALLSIICTTKNLGPDLPFLIAAYLPNYKSVGEQVVNRKNQHHLSFYSEKTDENNKTGDDSAKGPSIK